jgi:hypothetical protein
MRDYNTPYHPLVLDDRLDSGLLAPGVSHDLLVVQ